MTWNEWRPSRREVLAIGGAFIIGLELKAPSHPRFKRVVLEAADLDAQERFYGKTFGLTIIERTKDHLAIDCGATQLVFRQAPAGQKPYYHFAFNIPENLFEEGKKWLGERVKIVEKDGRSTFFFESWNAHACYYLDPCGNIGELIARHTLDNAAQRSFTSRDILCVSEVGIVTTDVLADCDRIEKAALLKPYRPPSDQFTAMGDEQGLLIVVHENRPWFGSDIKAITCEAEVQMSAGTKKHRLNAPKLTVIG